MKKILSFLLVLCMLCGEAVFVKAESTDIQVDDKTAYVKFGETVEEYRMKVDFCGSGYTSVKIGGRTALKRNYSSDATMFASFDIDDDFIFNNTDGECVEVTVEYYDGEEGSFTMVYDGVNNGINLGKWYSHAKDGATLEDTGKWKTRTFYFDDLKASNNDGYDFRVALYTPLMYIYWGLPMGEVCISSVTLRKVFKREITQIKSESEYVGNIFGNEDDKKMTIVVEDTLVGYEYPSDIVYNVTDYNGKVLKEGSFKKPASERVYKHEIDLNDITKFGNYYVNTTAISHLSADGEELEFEKTTALEFSVINKCNIEESNKHQYVCSHYVSHGIDTIKELVRYGGFAGIRDEVAWDSFETANGVYNYDLMDHFVEPLYERGKEVFYIGSYGNSLYADVQPWTRFTPPSTDAAIEGYANYCAAVAERYKGKIKYIEVWNEYNIAGFNPLRFSGAVYAKMLKRTYEKIKEVNPDITVVGICTAGMDLNFMKEVFDAGGYDYMDAISFHPYYWLGVEFPVGALLDAIDEFHKLTRQYGEDKPIYATEFGESTGGSGYAYIGTDVEQAHAVIKMYASSTGEKAIDKIFWYDLQDDNNTYEDKEFGFGLVRNSTLGGVISTPNAAKPSFIAMAGMNKMFYDAEPVDKFERDDGIWGYNFVNKSGENIAAIWADKGCEKMIGLDLGTNEIEMLDMYTNSMGKIKSTNGRFSISMGVEPIYIKGHFKSFKRVDENIRQKQLSVNSTVNDIFEIDIEDDAKRNLTFEADMTGGGKFIESINKGDGKYALKFKNGPDMKTGYVTIKAYSEKELVYLSETEINVVELMNISASTSQIKENDPDHWQALVKLKNESNTNSLSGYCRISKKDGVELGNSPTRFLNLAPKSEITLYLPLDPLFKKRNHELTIEVNTDDGYKKEYEQRVDFTAAKYANTPPVIDGKISINEWQGNWLCVDSKKRAKMQGWGGVNDLSFDCNMMWDTDNFYFAVVVNDDIFSQPEEGYNIWAGDCFQFAIEDAIYRENVVIDPNGVNSNFTEVGVALTKTGPTVYRFSSQDRQKEVGIVENCKTVVVRNEGKTIYEISIPWSELLGDGYVPDTDTVFGYSMLMNDNDGFERRGWLEYNEGIGMSKNSMKFARMRLVK